MGLFSIYLLLKVKMKQQLNEVEKLQKIAGLLKETINEAPLTINQTVKQLNKIANDNGFYAVDKSADRSEAGIKNLVKWESDNDKSVELFYTINKGKNITVDDLEIRYTEFGLDEFDSVEEWLDPQTWESFSIEQDYFSTPSKDLTPEEELEADIDDLQGDIDHTRIEIDEAEEEGDDEQVEYLEKELEKLDSEMDKLVDRYMKLKKLKNK